MTQHSGQHNIAGLCNGSTADSDSVCEGSNPSPAATEKSETVRFWTSFFLFDPLSSFHRWCAAYRLPFDLHCPASSSPKHDRTDIAVTSKKKFDDDFVVEMIQNLEDAKNVDTINGETLFSAPSASLSFRGKGATVKLAEDDGNLLKVFVANKQTAGFNPFD